MVVAGFNGLRPAHDQRLAQAAFIEVTFTGSIRCVVGCGRAGGLEDVQATIITREDEDGFSVSPNSSTLRIKRPTASSRVSIMAAYVG